MSEEARSSELYLPLQGLEPETHASGDAAGGTSVYKDVPGPLPLASRTFESQGGVLIVTCSGSGNCPNPPDTVGMAVVIDKRFAGMAYARVVTTETKFFSNTFAFGPILAGMHTMSVTPLGDTQTSEADIFNVSFVVQ